MAIITLNENGNFEQLAPAGVSLGVGVSQTGKDFEVASVAVVRNSREAGGSAVGISGDGIIWWNPSYNPVKHNSGWQSTIALSHGNVGIGDRKVFEANPPAEKLVVAGNILATGDVQLSGADCAEEFDLQADRPLAPGTVVVINEDGELSESRLAYDRKVAGVLSGAGTCRPGIVLGRVHGQIDSNRRMPLALAGRAFCLADAGYAPIRVGDLLTTSFTPGHAMKAGDPTLAFGAVLGKALQPLPSGQGLILVLVALQ